MQLLVDGILVNYLRSGKGQTILLMHGWGDSSFGLNNIQKELSNNFDVISPDLPGFGSTSAPPKDWGLDDYADFIVSFLKKAGISKLYAVIGHSNGGAIAIKLVSSKKLEIQKLILLSSAGIRTPDSLKLKSIMVGTKIGKALTSPLPKKTKEKLRKKHYANIGSDMLFNENMIGTFKKIVGEDVLNDAANIKSPTLLIYGEEDKNTPVSFGMMFHEKIDGSTLEIIPGAGHFIHQEESDKVLKLITDFL